MAGTFRYYERVFQYHVFLLIFLLIYLTETHAESKTTVILHILVKHPGKVTVERFKLDVLSKTLLKLPMKRIEKISNRARQNALSI